MEINPALTTSAFSQSAKASQTAQEFETFFIYQVLELMAPPPTDDSLFGGSFAEQMFRQTLNEKTAESIVDHGGLGIADSILDQITKMQEATP
jgi:Rod binding domain-containing protein